METKYETVDILQVLRKEILNVTIKKRHIGRVKIRSPNFLSLTTVYEEVTEVEHVRHRNEAEAGQKFEL